MFEKGIALRQNYETYQKRYIKQLVKQLTPGQRASLLQRVEPLEGMKLFGTAQLAVNALKGEVIKNA